MVYFKTQEDEDEEEKVYFWIKDKNYVDFGDIPYTISKTHRVKGGRKSRNRKKTARELK